MHMQGKVALVTGGNSGIGRGIVHRFVREGAAVAFRGRDEAKGAAVEGEVAELGGEGGMMVLDYPSMPMLEGIGERLMSRGSARG